MRQQILCFSSLCFLQVSLLALFGFAVQTIMFKQTLRFSDSPALALPVCPALPRRQAGERLEASAPRHDFESKITVAI
jgi:hypothetical protein